MRSVLNHSSDLHLPALSSRLSIELVVGQQVHIPVDILICDSNVPAVRNQVHCGLMGCVYRERQRQICNVLACARTTRVNGEEVQLSSDCAADSKGPSGFRLN